MFLAHLNARRFRNDEPGTDGSGTPTPPADLPTIGDGDPAIGGGETASLAAEPSSPTRANPDAGDARRASLSAALDVFTDPNGDKPASDPAPVADTRPRNPDGTFAAKAPADPNAPQPDPNAQPKPEAKPADDLAKPEGMTPRAAERWDALTGRLKETETKYTETAQALDSVRALVRESGLAPNEFTEMLDMARAFKAGDASALQMLDGLRSDLARRLGVEVPGVDLLDKHPDLKADVDGMLMTRERALEIANLRAKHAEVQASQQQQSEMLQHQQLVQQAAQAMDTELSRRAATPGHQERLNAIGNYFKDPAKMQEFVKTYQPQQWAKVLGLMYDNIQIAAPAPRTMPNTPQPLRPSNTRAAPGGAPTGPMTAMAAAGAAFDALGI